MSPVTPSDHARGPEDAQITLVQYGDFECPFGSQVHQIATEMRAAFPDDIRFVFRHFPLKYHANALNAALAAEAVARASGEEAFWAYHDRLFANQLAQRPEHLAEHAEAVGAAPEAVWDALDEETGKTEILAQKRGAVKAGLRSTLALFIDGELYQDDDLEDAIIERIIQPLKAG